MILVAVTASACNRNAGPSSAAPDLCQHLATLQHIQGQLKGRRKARAIPQLTASAGDLTSDATALTESGKGTDLAKQVASVEGFVQVEVISLKDGNSTTLRTGMTDTTNALASITACATTAQ